MSYSDALADLTPQITAITRPPARLRPTEIEAHVDLSGLALDVQVFIEPADKSAGVDEEFELGFAFLDGKEWDYAHFLSKKAIDEITRQVRVQVERYL